VEGRAGKWALRASVLVVVGAAGLAAALWAPAAHTAPQAAGSATYVDEAGDSGVAPDVRQLTISDDGAGNLTFAFVVADFATPANTSTIGDRVYLCLDSDENWSTGSPGGGCDYAFAVQRSLANQLTTFYAWNGTAMGEVGPGKLTAVGEADTLSVSFNESLIAGSTSFDFYVRTSEFSSTKLLGVEYAPSHGWWRFMAPPVAGSGTTTTAPPPPTTPAPEASVVGAPVTSGPAVAGRRFDAVFSVTGTTPATARVTVAGKAVRASTRYVAGNEHVSLVVPKSARGKTLQIRVAAGSFVRATSFRIGAR
jgi:hypothetical protein